MLSWGLVFVRILLYGNRSYFEGSFHFNELCGMNCFLFIIKVNSYNLIQNNFSHSS